MPDATAPSPNARPRRINPGRPAALAVLSAGAMMIVFVGVASTLLLALWGVIWPTTNRTDLELWTFASNHYLMYKPMLEDQNEQNGADDLDVTVKLLSGMVLQRRMLASFLYDTPVADMMEVERSIMSQAFSGPIEAVGFHDLTERLHTETINGVPLIEQINAPSFIPWSNRGRIFGLPHDVHPVVLAYRADIVEAAGIDVDEIETWDDFERITAPLRIDKDGDGRPDQYPLNLSETAGFQIEALMLQAGGGHFNADMEATVNSDVNARVAARVVKWIAGPGAIAGDAPEFSDTGNQLRIRGFVVFSIAPDWLIGVWQQNIAGLHGKIKVMPMPAWEPGGRRTSCVGGTMLGFPTTSKDFEAAWQLGLELYTDPRIARELWETNRIISPMKALWDEPFYDEPCEYFADQRVGKVLIGLAPDVPKRYTHPYLNFANGRYLSVIQTLKLWAERNNTYDDDALLAKAGGLLDIEQANVLKAMSRNEFIRPEDGGGNGSAMGEANAPLADAGVARE